MTSFERDYHEKVQELIRRRISTEIDKINQPTLMTTDNQSFLSLSDWTLIRDLLEVRKESLSRDISRADASGFFDYAQSLQTELTRCTQVLNKVRAL